MSEPQTSGSTPHDLETLIDRLAETASEHERISVQMMLDVAGRRSFGPLLLVCGIIPASPLSGVPGLPSVVAVIVVLLAAQLLAGRRSFSLPASLLNRSVTSGKLQQALTFLRPIAHFVDKLIRPRLVVFTHDTGMYVIAALSVAVAATMPVLELVPFANTANGLALSAFGLALIADDGLLALVALAFCAAGFYLVVAALPF